MHLLSVTLDKSVTLMQCNVMVHLGLSLELKSDLGLEKAGDHCIRRSIVTFAKAVSVL